MNTQSLYVTEVGRRDIMPLFKRKNDPTISEIESYYEQQNRRSNSTGRAWAMAILAIALTAIVLGILFFGGRWLYNTLTDSNGSEAPEVAQQDVNSGTIDDVGFDSDSADTSNENSSDSEGRVDDEAATTDEPNVDRVAGNNSDEETSTGTTSGNVAGSQSNIPNTGPGETALVIAIFAGIVATLTSYRKKLQ